MKSFRLGSTRDNCCYAGMVIAFLCVALGIVWMGVAMARARRQREAKRVLENIDAMVLYHWQDDYVESPYPGWFEAMLGTDVLGRVDVVLVYGKTITDHAAAALGDLHDLERLTLNGSTMANDGLRHIRHLGKLRYLDLGHTGVGDSELEHVACLSALEELKLNDTGITDAGLRQLADLQMLKTLNLSGTHVTDVGILSLVSLQSLETVELYDTGVTSEGVAALETALPRLHIGHYAASVERTGATAGP